MQIIANITLYLWNNVTSLTWSEASKCLLNVSVTHQDPPLAKLIELKFPSDKPHLQSQGWFLGQQEDEPCGQHHFMEKYKVNTHKDYCRYKIAHLQQITPKST